MINDNKKEDHSTGVSDGIKKFLMENLIKSLKKVPYQESKKPYPELKNVALSRNLIKSIKKYFIINLIKNLKNGTLSRHLVESIKKRFIKNLIKNLKKVPYRGT